MNCRTRALEFVLAFILPIVACALAFYAPTLPFGSRFLTETLGILSTLLAIGALGLLAFLVVLFVPLEVLKIITPPERRVMLRVTCLLGAVVLGAFLGASIGRHLRTGAFKALAARSEPLVTAIQRYEQEHGTLPASLDDLTPRWLDAVPSTGMGGYPDYEYLVGEEAARYKGNPWVLRVEAFGPGMQWDTFLYFPNQDYPKYGYGGSIEPLAGWAYVHE